MSGAGNSGEKKPRGRPFPPKTSGNPNGRPKGAAGLAKYLRKQTRNGKEGGDFLRAVVRGEVLTKDWVKVRQPDGSEVLEEVERPPAVAERIAAQKVIYDRMHGTAQKFIEVTGAGGSPLSISLENLEHLSDEDLEALGRIAQRALHGPGDAEGGGGGEGEERSGSES